MKRRKYARECRLDFPARRKNHSFKGRPKSSVSLLIIFVSILSSILLQFAMSDSFSASLTYLDRNGWSISSPPRVEGEQRKDWDAFWRNDFGRVVRYLEECGVIDGN